MTNHSPLGVLPAVSIVNEFIDRPMKRQRSGAIFFSKKLCAVDETRTFTVFRKNKSGDVSGLTFLHRLWRDWTIFTMLMLIICPTKVLALWWAAGGQLMLDRQTICRKSSQIGGRQDEMCRNEPEIIDEVLTGVQLAMEECQIQFQDRRWNCTSDKTSMSNLLRKKMDTKEAAFIQAITSVGILHSVADGCSKGRLLQCSCDSGRPSEPPSNGENWVWGGCADDVGFAYTKSKEFVDVERKHGNDFGIVLQHHNYEAGRLASTKYMRTTCKCHGLSGSCAMKTCWRRLPVFSNVGDRLRSRYDGAVQVTASNHAGPVAVSPGRRVLREPEDLIYSQSSPDFCRRKRKKGMLGTTGRACDPKSIGLGGCDILCCARGYRVQQVTVVTNCKCKFHWCCDVICQTCQQQFTVHICK